MTTPKKTATSRSKAPAKAAPTRAESVEHPAAEAVPEVNKRALFDRTKARAGHIKGRDVKAVMDIVLEEIGAALVAGEALNLPPLGKVKVQRMKALGGSDVVICKLRRKKLQDDPQDPLAEAAE